MTREEIIENNKFIAEFMGQEFVSKEAFIAKYPKDFMEASDSYKCFHNSWDWLMPVVRRIIKVCKPTTECPINRQRVILFKSIGIFSPITEVYKACAAFIKWFNDNK